MVDCGVRGRRRAKKARRPAAEVVVSPSTSGLEGALMLERSREGIALKPDIVGRSGVAVSDPYWGWWSGGGLSSLENRVR